MTVTYILNSHYETQGKKRPSHNQKLIKTWIALLNKRNTGCDFLSGLLSQKAR